MKQNDPHFSSLFHSLRSMAKADVAAPLLRPAVCWKAPGPCVGKEVNLANNF